MSIKEIYRIWEETDFKDTDMKKTFERAINADVVIELLSETEMLRSCIDEISEADCMGEVSKTLRQYGIDT